MLKTADIQIRDPFILNHNGMYYMYGSTDKDIWHGSGAGFNCYAGTDLASWDGPNAAFRPPPGFWGTKNFWAPEVYERDGAFYMFASFLAEGYMRGTAILRAVSPLGPFLPWSEGAVTPPDWMCLDGTFYIEDGQPWIIFCHEWVQIGDGTVCASRLSPDLKRTVSEPVRLFRSSEAPWSAEAFSPSNNIRGKVTDGCFMHRAGNGELFMLWSCVGEKGYCLGYAKSLSGSVIGPWEQAEKPLFAADGGHGMIFKTFEGALMLTLHSPNETPWERAAFIPIMEIPGGFAARAEKKKNPEPR
ncbi:MAG: glycoside hydrolase family 43 protein [Clostridiales bacterium]|jgi:hypothetical protein|nr:glycoside hydrolase family 43 protein [Clostridiales bacterium]